MSYITRQLRPKIAQQAKHQCGYCQTQERVSGIPLTVEHIIPTAKGGLDEEENLWLSCRLCNEQKGSATDGLDPETNTRAPLFNPRTQQWSEHFRWSEDGVQIIGQTAVGRATIETLNLNAPFRVSSRRLWVEVGWHPPH